MNRLLPARMGALDDPNPLALSNAQIALSAAGTALGAYHGFRRNDSIGWAIGWAILGGMFPLVTIPVSVAQGFGKRA